MSSSTKHRLLSSETIHRYFFEPGFDRTQVSEKVFRLAGIVYIILGVLMLLHGLQAYDTKKGQIPFEKKHSSVIANETTKLK